VEDNPMTIYIGLDVHSKHSTFEIQDADGKILGTGEVPTGPVGFSELKSKYNVPDGTACALETGTVAFYCARQLAALKLKPVVVDAAEVRNKASRRTQKSDRRDAHEICEGLRRNIYCSIVHVPTPEISAMRDTLSRRRHFVNAQTREVNAVKCLLRSAGYGSRYKSLKTETAWNKLLDGLSDEATLCIYLNQHFAAWRCAGEHIATLEVMLRQQSS
jgi:transposase